MTDQPDKPATAEAAGPSIASADGTTDPAALPDRSQAFFNALLTEQFVLQSVRSTAVSESAIRASTYLTLLSSGLIAFGFAAHTRYATAIALGIGVLVFVSGVLAHIRLVEVALEDVAALRSMQRIRSYYSGLVPGAGAYFPIPEDSDAPSEMLAIGRRASWRGVFGTLPFTICSLNAVAGGVAAAAGTAELVPVSVAVIIGAAVALVAALFGVLYQERRYAALRPHDR